MLCMFMLIYANFKKDFRRAKVCKYIQKNMLKQIKINVCNFMQIYANLGKFRQIYANELRDLLLKIWLQQNLSMYINSEKRCLNRYKQMYAAHANLCK